MEINDKKWPNSNFTCTLFDAKNEFPLEFGGLDLKEVDSSTGSY